MSENFAAMNDGFIEASDKVDLIFPEGNTDLPFKFCVAENAGFCFGVRRACDMAYELARQKTPELYTLGELVHNDDVVAALQKQNVKVAKSSDDIPDGASVIIRAHGVAAAVQQQLTDRHCKIYDGTCPYVKRIHQIVSKSAKEGKGIIITGSVTHPEIKGVLGYAANADTVVLSTPEEAESLEFADKPWVLVSQTTFSAEKWRKIKTILEHKLKNLQIFATICKTTAERQKEACQIASQSDIMLVIGGKKSSNTQKLFDICQKYCPKTYLISGAVELRKFISNAQLAHKCIGVTAGASTPEEMIREVIYSMTEQNSLKNQDQPEVDFTEFIDNIPELKKGLIVKGNVIRYDSDFVYVDVKDKSEGKIPLAEFENTPDYNLDEAVNNHAEIEVYVRSIKNSDMGKEILLSKARVDYVKSKNEMQEAYDQRKPINVKIVRVVKDGVVAVYGTIDVYIHRSQLELSPVENLNDYVGKEIEVLLTQFEPDKRRGRISGSHRSLVLKDRRKNAKQIWDSIEVGQEYDGVVRSLTNFGAFVDIGGVDGLVHVSELSWNHIKNASEVVAVGDVIKVHVLSFDREKQRISLGYRKKEDDPYVDLEIKYPVGMIVRGIVVRMFPFGAFINIAPGIDALCHISQISDYHLTKPSDVLAEGMEVDARVVEVSEAARRISVSIRDVEPINPDPDSEIVKQAQERAEKLKEKNEQRGNRKSRRLDEKKEDDLPNSYTDNAARSSISDIAEFTAVTKEGSDFIDSVKE